MTDSAPTAPRRTAERGLSVYVGWWVVAAVVAAIVTWALDHPVTVDSWPRVGLLWVAMVVAGLVTVHVRVRDTLEAADVIEVAAVPLMALLDPLLAVVVGTTAALVFESSLTRGQLRKLAFNLAWLVLAVAGGAWASVLLGGEFGPVPDVLDLAGAVVAGVVYLLVNSVALAGIVARQAHRSWWSVMNDEAPASLLIGAGNVVLGVVAAVLAATVPLALPLLAVPLLLQRGRLLARSEGYHQLEVERERLRRTVQDSSDGVVLLEASGRVEVWNPAMRELTGADREQARGATLHELGLDALLGGGTDAAGGRRVEVRGRTVEVRRAHSSSGNRGAVLSVRDVTLEAELAQIRDDLVGRVSHELRTPLTTVGGFLEVLQVHWDALDDQRRRELVDVAHRGAERLSTLVADLMAWARVEARKHEPSAAEVPTSDVAEVLDRLVDTCGVRAHARLLMEDHHRVAVSTEDLRRMLEPLLVNAHTHGTPPVTVSAERVGDMLQIVVRDDGPGLPDTRADELFEPFTQGTLGLQRTETGLGLGLAIARGTAELVGGSLRYDPTSQGPRFVITLPRA